ncbi:MAG: flagellar hook-length control protein FliK [Acidihalobacter sp.]
MQTGIRVDARVGTGGASPDALQAWKTGQVLKALVVTGTPPEAGGGRAVLRIGNNEYAVRSQTPLQTGDTLELQVKRTQPEPVLQRLSVTPQAPGAERRASTQQSTNSLEQSVKSLLTQQSSLSNALRALTAKLPQLGAQTTQRLETLVASLPTPQKLTQAEGLRNAVATAGNHLEASLQQGRPPAATDIKLQLAQTLAGLSPAEARTVRTDLQGMASRISLNQLHSTQPATAGTHLFVELPLRTAQGFQEVRLEIQSESGGQPESPESLPDWSVRLQLDLPGLGPLEARVASVGGNVSARFWAEHQATAQRIEGALPELAAAWRDQGLQPGALQAYHGRAPAPLQDLPEAASGLVDTRA